MVLCPVRSRVLGCGHIFALEINTPRFDVNCPQKANFVMLTFVLRYIAKTERLV